MKKLVKVGVSLTASLLALGTAGAGMGLGSAKAATTANSAADATTEAGPLSITSAPNIDFGNITISTASRVYTSSGITNPLEVQNPGQTAGWQVTVSRTDFQNAAKTATLNGATLTLSDTGSTTESSTGALAANYPTAVTGGLNITDVSAPIYSAGPATEANPVGVGEFAHSYASNSASLLVPAQTQLPNTYTSTMNWTIQATPTASTTPAA